jgi:tetratricopeptide (TPR) repeat protein
VAAAAQARRVLGRPHGRPERNEQPAPTAARPDEPALVFQQATAAIERGDGTGGELMLAELLETHPGHQPSLLCLAERHDRAGNHAAALDFYERLLKRGGARAVDYFRASLAAYRVGNLARALGILQQAERDLPPGQMKGPLWYNLGCFAARLGRFADSLRYLNRAVDAGYSDAAKYRGDPDLEPLRWHAGFKRLLVGLG